MTTDGQHIRKGIIIILPGKKTRKTKFFLKEFCTLWLKVVWSLCDFNVSKSETKKTLTQKNKKLRCHLVSHYLQQPSFLMCYLHCGVNTMNRKSDQQLITPNSNTAKPFMHQGREEKNYDPEALMVNHDRNSFSSLLGYGITFNCVSIPIHNHSW